jgi:hypothetical protein
MIPLMRYSVFIISPSPILRYTRSQKRTYQKAMPKNKTITAMNIRSSIHVPPVLYSFL